MSVERVRDRRAERYAATRAEILAAAWELAEADGLGALAMRELGARVGMRAQSLYGYFPSKHAIFDAMFAAANEDLLQRMRSLPPVGEPVEALRQQADLFLRFCVESPVRYQLLFQRLIPGFEPTPDSYERAKEVLDTTRELLDACGITGQKALDVWTAITGGLAAQQNANQPGGDRWLQLLDEVIDIYLTRFRPSTSQENNRDH